MRRSTMTIPTNCRDLAVANSYHGSEQFKLQFQQNATANIDIERTDLSATKATPTTARTRYAFVADDEIGLAVTRES